MILCSSCCIMNLDDNHRCIMEDTLLRRVSFRPKIVMQYQRVSPASLAFTRSHISSDNVSRSTPGETGCNARSFEWNARRLKEQWWKNEGLFLWEGDCYAGDG